MTSPNVIPKRSIPVAYHDITIPALIYARPNPVLSDTAALEWRPIDKCDRGEGGIRLEIPVSYRSRWKTRLQSSSCME